MIDTDVNETWTIIDFQTLSGGLSPFGIELGDTLSYDVNNQQHFIAFSHFESSGYTITVEGPNATGSDNNIMTTLSNFCTMYPVIELNETELTIFIQDSIFLDQYVSNPSESLTYSIIFEDQLFEFPISGLEFGGGQHELILQASDSSSCLSERRLIVSVEVDATIPTMGEWGLINLALLLLIIGTVKLKSTAYVLE